MKLARSNESWRTDSVSPLRPKITSWCATKPGSLHRVHVQAALRTSSSRSRDDLGLGRVGSPVPGPGRVARAACMRRDGLEGGPRGRIALAFVMELDDLRAGHERGAQLRATHHQRGADGEVRGHDRMGVAREPGPQGLDVRRIEAGRAADRVDAMIGAPAEICHAPLSRP